MHNSSALLTAHREPNLVTPEQCGLSLVTFQRADINVAANSQLGVQEQARPLDNLATH